MGHSSTRPPTVLIVDDEPDIVTLMAEVLTDAGYRIVTARSAEEGLRVAAKERPDVILLDVSLPDMRGDEFARVYRERTPASDRAAIILTTAYADAATIAKRSGADGFLAKPFDLDDLITCVEAAVQRHARAA